MQCLTLAGVIIPAVNCAALLPRGFEYTVSHYRDINDRWYKGQETGVC